MAVILGVEPSGEGRLTYDITSKSIRTEHRLRIKMRTDAGSGEREAAVIAGCGVSIGDLWASGNEGDFKARCHDIVATEWLDNGTYVYWDVEATYSSRAPQESEDNQPPEMRIPEWEWSTETIDVLVPRDPITGLAISNSVGEPLFITGPVAIPVLTITRFATTFEDADIDDYVNHTNSAVFWGRAVKAGKMTSISDRGVDIDGRRMRQLQYQIKFGTLLPTGNWTVDLLDHGSKYFEVGAVSTLTDFQTKQGNPTTGNLNGLGFALAAGAPEVYLNFNLMETANFNDLKIGPTTWF